MRLGPDLGMMLQLLGAISTVTSVGSTAVAISWPASLKKLANPTPATPRVSQERGLAGERSPGLALVPSRVASTPPTVRKPDW
jgi:hypothetical protein